MTKQKHSQMPIVLVSIPISKDLKRYFWMKYHHLRTNNGVKYATDVFKALRETILRYVADNDRINRIDEYLKACPVRKNGWLKKLFHYADTDPQSVFQFLKLYLTEVEPVVTPEESAEAQATVLMKAQPTSYNPIELKAWLKFIWTRNQVVDKITRVLLSSKSKRYHYARKNLAKGYIRLGKTDYSVDTQLVSWIQDLLALGCTQDQIVRYHRRWHKIMTPRGGSRDCDVTANVRSHMPTRFSYVDSAYGDDLPDEFNENVVAQFDDDLCGFYQEIRESQQEALYSEQPDEFWALGDELNDADDEYRWVGQIHHIPKKGTVKRRAIAVPNRFLQAGLYPMRDYLRRIASSMPRNCQFDQDKMDREIYSHLMSDYASCVDLSQATDWLPMSWFDLIKDQFSDYWFEGYDDRSDDFGEVRLMLFRSFELFNHMIDSQWANGDYFSKWLRGQPLGTIPSFEILTITHICLIEAIAWSFGNLNSPYGVLGDDSVFFDKRVRDRYVEVMTEAGSPLSLHKSYEGRMVEFAGKLFVKNQHTSYSPTPSYLGWSNLFDYQRASRVVVKFEDLPKGVMKKLLGLVPEEYSSTGKLFAKNLYAAMQMAAGVPLSQVSSETADLLWSYYLAEDEDRDLPDEVEDFVERVEYSAMFDCLVFFGSRVSARPLRKTEGWFKQKYRPVPTDVIAERCLRFIRR